MPQDLALTFPPAEQPPALDDEAALVLRAAKKLRIAPREIAAVRVTKVSFDARRRQRSWRVALRVFGADEEAPARPATTPPTFERPTEQAAHVVIIGSGPTGMFAALDLLAAGLRVTVFERGRDVRTRRRPIRALLRGEPADPDCNYCFGEGGAGTYSDGKLYTRSKDKAGVRGVLELLVAHGAPPEILVSWRPHVGSNRLPEVVRSLRETILRSGGALEFGRRVEEIATETGKVIGVRVRNLDTDEVTAVAADAVILAAGHSALDSLEMARRAGAVLVAKGFAMGLRAEHPQAWLDERQYGGLRGPCDLPASFYELTTQVEGRGVYSFCMCPGGFIVPSTSAPERLVVNGMSLSRRDSPFANSGVVVAIEPEDWCGERGHEWGWDELVGELPATPDQDPLFGVRLQIRLEERAALAGGGRNRAPAIEIERFVAGTGPGRELPTSYKPGVRATRLDEVLPRGLATRLRTALSDFEGRLPGYVGAEGQLLGVESRTSSPVRLERDAETLESPTVRGLFPGGEGAGYAGGIVSAALDGRRVAAAVQARWTS
jgi:uncharacterized FAD-dependent dehydrogenase